jgi:prolyl oligopeptidase
MQYPESRKEEQIDDYFGTKVPDPYRWLEDDNAEEVLAWVKAQNELTFSYLEKIPFRQQLRDRYRQLFDFTKLSAPKKVGSYYFFYKNEGLQNQAVIYRQRGLQAEAEVFIDPNQLSEEGTVAITLLGASHDHRYLAYSRSEAGSDWSQIRIREVATGKELEDVIPWVKFSDTSWLNDGFFYTRYPQPQSGKEYSAQSRGSAIYYHKLGRPYEEDEKIYEDPDNPHRYLNAEITEDGAFLILYIRTGTDGFEVRYKDMKQSGWDFQLLFKGFENKSYVIDHMEGKFVVVTDKDAPNKRVLLIDPRQPEPENWQELIPEQEHVIEDVRMVGGKMFLSYLQHASSHVQQYDRAGKWEKEVELPSLGTVMFGSTEKEDQEFFYLFTSFTYPTSIFRYDMESGESQAFFRPEVRFEPDDYEVEQVFFPGKDGTRLSMFVVHRQGLPKDGRRPTYLYGYGGFNISLTPTFSVSHLLFLEQGGVLAIPNLRGGGEYGEAWHRAGMLMKKQNVFDDFIASAEYLIENEYTSPERLAVAGGSNGGLLVGAVINQRPELFRVALPAVGVLDMLRYHKFTVGWGWVPEYGSSEESEEMFRYLLSYSPLHNLRTDAEYPSVLIMTADHDDRVVPAHSFKYAAALQASVSGDHPLLIRIDTDAGHGAGKPTEKIIEEVVDRWAFVFYEMGMVPPVAEKTKKPE